MRGGAVAQVGPRRPVERPAAPEDDRARPGRARSTASGRTGWPAPSPAPAPGSDERGGDRAPGAAGRRRRARRGGPRGRRPSWSPSAPGVVAAPGRCGGAARPRGSRPPRPGRRGPRRRHAAGRRHPRRLGGVVHGGLDAVELVEPPLDAGGAGGAGHAGDLEVLGPADVAVGVDGAGWRLGVGGAHGCRLRAPSAPWWWCRGRALGRRRPGRRRGRGRRRRRTRPAGPRRTRRVGRGRPRLSPLVGQVVPGLVDRGAHGVEGQRLAAGDGDRTGGQVDLDLLDAGDPTHLGGDGVDAVLAAHPGDGVGGAGGGHRGSSVVRSAFTVYPLGVFANPFAPPGAHAGVAG